MSGVILAGTYRLGPGGFEAARTAIETIVAASRAEPGCLAYAHARDAVDSATMRVFEYFSDDGALAFHRASAHLAAWRSVWTALGLHGRDLMQFTVAQAAPA
jgi:quinol monooxygenase YgiN